MVFPGPERLEIFIPSNGLTISVAIATMVVVSGTFDLVRYCLLALRGYPVGTSASAVVFSLILYSLLGLWCAFQLVGYTVVTIDNQRIYKQYKILRWSFGIRELVLKRPIRRIEKIEARFVSGGLYNVTEKAKLVLFSGDRTFTLTESKQFSDAELNWLATEISTWLQIPFYL